MKLAPNAQPPRGGAFDGKGKVNIYTCQKCRGHIVTRDLDSGVTPFSLSCRATPDCDGWMASSMYRVFDQTMREGWQWYRPTPDQVLNAWELDHVANGGLLLQEATFPEEAKAEAPADG